MSTFRCTAAALGALPCALLFLFPLASQAPQPPRPAPKFGTLTQPRAPAGDFIIKDFQFASGETLPELRIHYRTLGAIQRDNKGIVTNAVLILHGTGGEGGNLLGSRAFAGELFGPGQPLDAAAHFLIFPDNIGHGRSSKPSDGLKGKFPRYGYRDMVAIQHRLLTDGLNVNHLRLVIGTSMGGMHTWLWGQTWPDFMDALMPLASLPTQISGRNRAWRRLIADAIRHDPLWNNGDYEQQPPSLRTGAAMLYLMSSNPVIVQRNAPTLKDADAALDRYVDAYVRRGDANNLLYAVEASRDYDPGPGLEKIQAPLVAINFADDLINPPELGILEREIRRVKNGKAILIPFGPDTVGHGTHTKASVWKDHLVELLKNTEKPAPAARDKP
jgi:homoserine O-acetyltransferase